MSGVNNEYRGGCLIVFDTRDIQRRLRPQSGEYVCQGIGPGSMLYYVITPYVDVSEASGDRVDGLRLDRSHQERLDHATYHAQGPDL